MDRTKMVANLTTTAQTVTKMTAETTARMEKGLTIMIAINSICTAQLVLNISLGLFFKSWPSYYLFPARCVVVKNCLVTCEACSIAPTAAILVIEKCKSRFELLHVKSIPIDQKKTPSRTREKMITPFVYYSQAARAHIIGILGEAQK